jgi:hypothetical protein
MFFLNHRNDRILGCIFEDFSIWMQIALNLEKTLILALKRGRSHMSKLNFSRKFFFFNFHSKLNFHNLSDAKFNAVSENIILIFLR